MRLSTEEQRNARLTDVLDGKLEIELSPLERSELDAADAARSLLKGLPAKRPPRDLLHKVKQRIRRRSGGRYFHPASAPPMYRISVEIFAVIAVVVMAACYIIVDSHQAPPEPLVEEPPLELIQD